MLESWQQKKNIITLPLEKWTLCLAINDAIIMWYFPRREILRAQLGLSFKPAGGDSARCLKTLQQGVWRLEPKYSDWMIILCYRSNTQEKHY